MGKKEGSQQTTREKSWGGEWNMTRRNVSAGFRDKKNSGDVLRMSGGWEQMPTPKETYSI